MASPVTKNSYIDNEDSLMKGYVEVGYHDKKAFVKHYTLEIVNEDNIPLNIPAMALAVQVADLKNCWDGFHRTSHEEMTYAQAIRYLKKEAEKWG